MPARLARALPAGCEGGISSERDRLADFLGHKALLCVTQSGRRMDWWVQAGDGGDPAPGVLRKRVPVLGRE